MQFRLKIFEAFSGYGSQSLALKYLNIPHEVVGISEIDKYAIEAYYLLHDKTIPNFGDISKINPQDIPKHDLFTYSFPCQDISVCGNMKGLAEGTRSGLLYECKKIIDYHKPKYLLLENVSNLVSSKFINDFNNWLKYLESLGYSNYWQILNAKDFNIPQNRNRVFVVSILNEDKNNPFKFPDKQPLLNTLNKVCTDFDINQIVKNKNEIYIDKNIKNCVRKNYIRDKDEIAVSNKEIYSCKCTSGWNDNKVGIKISPTLRALNSHTCVLANNVIRKITPREALRLMGVKEKDINKLIDSDLSNTQIYKLAGNSIVVNVLMGIFKNLYIEKEAD